jgi:hypothetical protein
MNKYQSKQNTSCLTELEVVDMIERSCLIMEAGERHVSVIHPAP